MEKAKYRTDICQTCKHFDIETDIATHQHRTVCTRWPKEVFAQAVPVPPRAANEQMGIQWYFVAVHPPHAATDHCGEWSKKFGD